MKVRLLSNVVENGGIKMARRHLQPDGKYKFEQPFVKGAPIEMSDKSAQKYIDKGLAEAVTEDDQP